jgi:hypothetical protein
VVVAGARGAGGNLGVKAASGGRGSRHIVVQVGAREAARQNAECREKPVDCIMAGQQADDEVVKCCLKQLGKGEAEAAGERTERG